MDTEIISAGKKFSKIQWTWKLYHTDTHHLLPNVHGPVFRSQLVRNIGNQVGVLESSLIYLFVDLNMSSSAASDSTDSNSNLSNTRQRYPSLSSFSRIPLSIVNQPISSQSQTTKVRRKTISNLPSSYVAPTISRSDQSTSSMISFDNKSQELDTNADQLAIDINVMGLVSQQNPPRLEPNVFEKSPKNEKEVSYVNIIGIIEKGRKNAENKNTKIDQHT